MANPRTHATTKRVVSEHALSAPSLVDRIKTTLVGLRMPRALEIVDVIVRQLERGETTALEAIDSLLMEELTLRETRRVKTALVMARLSTLKTLSGFDFSFQPSLDRGRILALAELKFIDRSEAVHFVGPPGTGKSHLGVALGVEAVRAGRSVHFITLADLIDALARAEREGSLRQKIRFYGRFALAAQSAPDARKASASQVRPYSETDCHRCVIRRHNFVTSNSSFSKGLGVGSELFD